MAAHQSFVAVVAHTRWPPFCHRTPQCRKDKSDLLDAIAALSAGVSTDVKRPFYRRLDAESLKQQHVDWMSMLEEQRRRCVHLTLKWDYSMRRLTEDMAALNSTPSVETHAAVQ